MKSYAKTACIAQINATVSPENAQRGAYGKKTGKKFKKAEKMLKKVLTNHGEVWYYI